MGKTTNAEKCKTYREKNKETYRKNDNLRKKHTRAPSKATNSEAYENLKLAERLKNESTALRKSKKKKLSPTNLLPILLRMVPLLVSSTNAQKTV